MPPIQHTNFWTTLPRPIFALAPMVDITDSAFRQIAKRWGADVVYSEMISAEALARGNRKTLAMLANEPCEYPLVVQLMGREPSSLARAAQLAEARGAAGIDLNFGCPARKIAKNFCGAMLMRDAARARLLIEAAAAAVSIPVSIKVRTSITEVDAPGRDTGSGKISILDFLSSLKGAPIAAIMVHGRSFEAPFDGPADLVTIRAVKQAFSGGPVLANGALTDVPSAADILKMTGADGLGLARSAIGKPWIFRQIKEYLSQGTYSEPSSDEILSRMMEHAELFDSIRGTAPFARIRRHLSHYVRGFPDASRLRQRLLTADSPRCIRSAVTA